MSPWSHLPVCEDRPTFQREGALQVTSVSQGRGGPCSQARKTATLVPWQLPSHGRVLSV